MTTYTKIRLLLGLAAIFVFIYMLDGPPCLGEANGSNRVNNLRIFQDNRELLNSPNEISIGQNLIVPKLSDSEIDRIKIWGIFPNSMFELVESVGRRYIPSDSQEANQSKQYVVREGDSLWKIAAELLGNGSRYKEISKLNADVLKNEHDLSIGMRLSLPDQQQKL
jgi:LysM repeat protein